MKTCFKCGAEKALTDFYKHPKMADGHVNKCKECNKKDVRENRAAKVEQYREYDARRFQDDPRVKARHKRYKKTDAGRVAMRGARNKWRASNEDKQAAHTILNNAVRDGRISKPETCTSCGKGGVIHGHHEDYARPLCVAWLCPQCHVDTHRGEKC